MIIYTEVFMSSFIIELFSNKPLVCAGASWALAQIIKTIIHLILTRKFVAERLIGSGGMPSCHSAAVCALTTAILIEYGPGEPFFAIAVIMSIVVMYDAMGVRRETGIQATVLNEMIGIFAKLGNEIKAEDRLKEFVGHTPFQVLIGGILGIAFACLYCLVFTR